MNSITFNEERDEETCYGYCNEYQPHAAVDDKYFSYYAYDHTGQRTLKMTGDASTVDVNAWEQHTYGCLDHVTLYPSPYMVLTEQGYTKHYYAGTERVAARIGSGGLSYDATCVTANGEVAKRSDELFWNGVKLLNEHKTKPEDFKEMSLVDARGKEVDWHKKIDLDKLAMSWQLEAKIDPGKIHFIIDDNSYPAMPGNTRYENEPDVYFYHSDHLGSANWITDHDGNPVQHLQYLPYGEPYVGQRTSGYSERFTFTGKERDEETGYGYFGARYMDHELMTMWLSVDPMADKYPSISPYAYCNWNPVKLVDPDGRDVWEVTEDGHVINRNDAGGKEKQTIIYANGKREVFSGLYYHSILSDLTSVNKTKLTNGEPAEMSKSEGTVEKKYAMGKLFLSLVDNTNVEWALHKFKGGKYDISTLHNRELSASPETLGKSMSDLITMIHSHPSAEPNKKEELSSMGLFTKDGTHSTLWYSAPNSDYSKRYYNYPENVNYYVYMKKSYSIYSMGKGQWPRNKCKITKPSQLPW